jgi:hypothetical protein
MVTGYMLSHDTGGMDDTVIVDAAIEDSHDDGELQCEAPGCGEYAEVASITPRTITYRHVFGKHDHQPLITEDGQRAALIGRVLAVAPGAVMPNSRKMVPTRLKTLPACPRSPVG